MSRAVQPVPSAPPKTEKQFQSQIVELARLRGYLCYHTFSSLRSTPGFPDCVLARPGRLLFRELKTERGRVSAAQQQWLTTLRAAGADAGIWRPSDLAAGRVLAELDAAR